MQLFCSSFLSLLFSSYFTITTPFTAMADSHHSSSTTSSSSPPANDAHAPTSNNTNADTVDQDTVVADSLDTLLGVGMVDQDILERDIIAKVREGEEVF